jgi:hypothetical protein
VAKIAPVGRGRRRGAAVPSTLRICLISESLETYRDMEGLHAAECVAELVLRAAPREARWRRRMRSALAMRLAIDEQRLVARGERSAASSCQSIRDMERAIGASVAERPARPSCASLGAARP